MAGVVPAHEVVVVRQDDAEMPGGPSVTGGQAVRGQQRHRRGAQLAADYPRQRGGRGHATPSHRLE